MFEARLLGLDCLMEMKTGEEGGIAFRETFCFGDWPTLGRWGSRIEVCWVEAKEYWFCGGVGIGGRSKVSVDGRGESWNSEGA